MNYHLHFDGYRQDAVSGPIITAVCAQYSTPAATAAGPLFVLFLHAARVGERERVERPGKARFRAAAFWEEVLESLRKPVKQRKQSRERRRAKRQTIFTTAESGPCFSTTA